MKTRWSRQIWIGLLLAVVSRGAAGASSEKVFPPEPFLFFAIRDMDGLRKNFALTPAAKVWAEPALAPLKEACAKAGQDIRAAVESAPPEARQGMARVVSSLGMIRQAGADLADLSFALYMQAPAKAQTRAQTDVNFYFKGQFGGATLERLKTTIFAEGLCQEVLPHGWNLLDREVEKAVEQGKAKREELPNGALLLEATGKSGAAMALAEGLLVCSTNAQWARDMALGQAVAEGVDPAAQAFGEKAGEPGIILVEDLRPVWDMLNGVEENLKRAGESAAQSETPTGAGGSGRPAQELAKLRMVRELLGKLGLDSVQSVAVRHWFGEEGFQLRAETAFRDQPQGLLDMGPNRPFQIGQWAPAGLTSAREDFWRPGKELMAIARGTIVAVGGAPWGATLDRALARVQKASGIDLEKDVLENLAGHSICCSARSTQGAPAQLPPAFLGMEAVDGAALVGAMDRLLALLPAPWSVTSQERTVGSATYKTFGSALFPMVQPAYGVVDGMFLLATSGAALEAAAQAHGAGGVSESKEAIQSALKKAGLPSEGHSLQYGDPREGLRGAQKAAATVGPFLPLVLTSALQKAQTAREKEIARVLGASAGSILLAVAQLDLEPMCAHLFPRTAVAWREGNKEIQEERSALDEQLIVGTAVGAVVGVVVAQSVKKAAERKGVGRRALAPPPPQQSPKPATAPGASAGAKAEEEPAREAGAAQSATGQ